MEGGQIPKSNDPERVPVMFEPGTSYFSRRVIEKYGRSVLEAITNNQIEELSNELSEEIHDIHKDE